MSTILFYFLVFYFIFLDFILFSHIKLLGLEASEYSTLAGLFLMVLFQSFDIPNLLLLSSYEKEQQR